MLDRSWLVGFFYIFSGYAAAIVGKDATTIYPPCEDGQYDKCVGPYHPLLDQTKDIVVVATHVVLMVYLLNCILCFKFRSLARYNIYFVLTTRIMFTSIPTPTYRGFHEFIHVVNSLSAYLGHYCGSYLNMYFITLVLCFEMVFSVHFAYNREFGAE